MKKKGTTYLGQVCVCPVCRKGCTFPCLRDCWGWEKVRNNKKWGLRGNNLPASLLHCCCHQSECCPCEPLSVHMQWGGMKNIEKGGKGGHTPGKLRGKKDM